MRIDSVKADAFGPFSKETLDLAPGMTVIHGPNESGKSSWHAAIYAAVCGVKRNRGQTTKEGRMFTRRHRPRRSKSWRVSAVVALDDGRIIEIDQRVGRRAHSSATDLTTNEPLSGDIVRDGAVDGATFLGLTRETALATVFVRQADMLRVMNDARALQEYLERAAASTASDTTADEALERIASYREAHVGRSQESAGPLADARRRLEEATRALDGAEAHVGGYEDLLARRHALDADVAHIERQLDALAEHEAQRERQERWAEIRAAERRLSQARGLAEAAATGPTEEAASKEVVGAVTRALATYDARPAEPAPLEGPSADDLESELADLPDEPEGDVEPATEVVASWDAWHQGQQRLAAHEANQPTAVPAEDSSAPTGPSAADLEAELAALPLEPEGDLEPDAEVTSAREAWHTQQQRLTAHESHPPETPAPPESPAPPEQATPEQAPSGEASPGGATAAEIERELSALPAAPDGDLEPQPEVVAARDTWHDELQRLAAHDAVAPQVASEALPTIPSDEVRRLADGLETPVPEVDPEIREMFAQRRAAEQRAVWEMPMWTDPSATNSTSTRTLGRLASAGGAVVAVLGLVVAVAAAAVIGAALVVLGVTAIGLGVALLRRRPGLAVGTRTQPSRPSQPDIDRLRAEAQQWLEAEAVARSRRQREAAAARLGELDLPADPTELRRLASVQDAQARDAQRLAEWQHRRVELEDAASDAAQALRESLAAHGVAAGAHNEDLSDALARYVDACRERAQRAAQAARRPDLEARLRERRATEAAHTAAGVRVDEWRRRRGEIVRALRDDEQRLVNALNGHGTTVMDHDTLDDAYQRYAHACRRRAQQAALAARRPDLEARLHERRAAETALVTAAERVAAWERRRGELEGEISDAEAELRAFLTAHGITPTDHATLDGAFHHYAEACRERAQQAALAARRPDLEARLQEHRAAEAARDQDVAARNKAQEQLAALASDAGCESESTERLPDALRLWVSAQEELTEAWNRHATTSARLEQVLDGLTVEDLDAQVTAMRAEAGDQLPDDTEPLADQSDELGRLRRQARQERESLAELVGQIEEAEKHLLDVTVLTEERARAGAEVSRLTTLAADLDIATEILAGAQEKVHADIAPVLNETIRPWVPRITGGHYDDARVDPATLEIEVRETGGDFHPATMVSHGTTEQLFLLLRLALAQQLTTTGEKAPIILDDITVQSDSMRTVAALDLLHEISAEHQVVLFSQEDEVLAWAEEQLVEPADRLVRLQPVVPRR